LKERGKNGYEQREADKKLKRKQEKREMDRKERKEADRQDRQKARKKRARNKEFARVTYIFVILFLVMMGYISYFIVVKSREVIRSSYNPRLDSYADRVIRGKILDKTGKILADTEVDDDGTERRVYPYGNMFAHVVGYTDKGKSGLESIANFELLTSNAFFLEKLMTEFQNKKNIGDNVVSTLDVTLQEAAYHALGSSKGAVVVMEPSTGKILAMVSKPDYNPETIAADWDAMTSSGESVLLNRATQGLYAPGSTFKIVTALEYMRENSGYSGYSYDCEGKIEKAGTTIHCYNGKVHGTLDLKDSFAYSCNASFCNIGLQLDVNKFRATAKELLFNRKLPSELSYNKSTFSLEENDGDAAEMMTAMGQGQTQVSPYHMALITAAIANNGTLMRPYLIDSVTNYKGTIIDKNEPAEYAELMTADEAARLKEYMSGVVEYGTASVLSGQEYTAAGKTGTAEYSSDKSKDHSWFVGMSNVDSPDMVISVIIEGSDGSSKAVNVAKAVFDAYY